MQEEQIELDTKLQKEKYKGRRHGMRQHENLFVGDMCGPGRDEWPMFNMFCTP